MHSEQADGTSSHTESSQKQDLPHRSWVEGSLVLGLFKFADLNIVNLLVGCDVNMRDLSLNPLSLIWKTGLEYDSKINM